MKILEIINFDDFPEEIAEDETIKQVMSIGEHIWIATERSLYIMLEDDEDFPPGPTQIPELLPSDEGELLEME